jgi:hypothetical protein
MLAPTWSRIWLHAVLELEGDHQLLTWSRTASPRAPARPRVRAAGSPCRRPATPRADGALRVPISAASCSARSSACAQRAAHRSPKPWPPGRRCAGRWSPDSVDRRRTSAATTAKPRPLSPARAASMAALIDSRLVWRASLPTSSAMSPRLEGQGTGEPWRPACRHHERRPVVGDAAGGTVRSGGHVVRWLRAAQRSAIPHLNVGNPRSGIRAVRATNDTQTEKVGRNMTVDCHYTH